MRLSYLILLALGLVLFSCSDDSDEPTEGLIINYDSDNVTAPNLPAGFYEFAVRFPANITRDLVDRQLTQVSFYLYERPDELWITVSPDATATTPGNLLVEQQVTNLRSNSWNTISLDSPYTFSNNAPIWIGVQIIHNQSALQTVGCDAGPANPNGDWLFDDADGQWLTFRDRVNDSVNWNIRAIISDQ
ncbi:MAG: hypothetical protein AAFQ02_00475 [Bacteroidota bacterium]